MTKKELLLIAKQIKSALEFESSQQSRPREHNCAARAGIYSTVNNLWYEVIQPNEQYRTWFPDSDDWFRACGFRTWQEMQEDVA